MIIRIERGICMAEISVLMPIYNADKYLYECLESIKAQSFTNFEVLMIVDGATDSSLDICSRFMKEDVRFCVRNQENCGSGKTRNRLIDWAMKSTSKFITWIDADDVVHPLFLEHLYRTINEHPECDLIQCRYVNELENLCAIPKQKEVHFTNKELLTEMLGATYGIDFSLLWNKIYRKEIYDNIRIRITDVFSGRMQDDVNILSQIYKISKGCILINEYLYYYRIVPNSIQHKKISSVNLEYLYIYRDLYLECKDTEFDSFANYLGERILFEIAGKLRGEKNDYIDYVNFYSTLKSIYQEFYTQIDFHCKRIDLKLLNVLVPKCFYAFRIYAKMYTFRGEILNQIKIMRTRCIGNKK